jgi:hypothetical protein
MTTDMTNSVEVLTSDDSDYTGVIARDEDLGPQLSPVPSPSSRPAWRYESLDDVFTYADITSCVDDRETNGVTLGVRLRRTGDERAYFGLDLDDAIQAALDDIEPDEYLIDDILWEYNLSLPELRALIAPRTMTLTPERPADVYVSRESLPTLFAELGLQPVHSDVPQSLVGQPFLMLDGDDAYLITVAPIVKL